MSSRIAEVLGVLQLIHTGASSSISKMETRRRRLDATKRIAAQHSITHETVRDACTRQLEPHVRGIDQFDSMVHAWLTSESTDMRAALLQHAVDSADFTAVERFFAER